MMKINVQEMALLISDICSVSLDDINGETLILRDLKVWGDDAWDLIEGIESRWKIDLSGFEFQRYFPVEGSFAFSVSSFNSVCKAFEPLSVTNLVDLANAKQK